MGILDKMPIPDEYEWRARIQPALVVAFPLGLAGSVWSPTVVSANLISGFLMWGGGTMLISQLARECGKRRQRELFARMGGTPTTRLLRHRGANNRVVIERRHKKLQALIPDIHMPSYEEEARDPQQADDVYENCVRFLRERTRNKKNFRLVFEENCHYGFRRNLWGLKVVGIVTTLLALIASATHLALSKMLWHTPFEKMAIVSFVVSVLLLVSWVFIINRHWVQTAGETYAEQLLAACERL